MQPGRVPLQSVVRSGVSLAALLLWLFGGAGTLDWPRGWGFVGLCLACGFGIGEWLRRTDPALLAARMASPLDGAQTRRDRLVMLAIVLVFIGWLLLMALDARRFGWSRVPAPLGAVGVLLILAAHGAWVWVLRENSFAAVTIRVQAERAQRVVDTGPYALVRHPMYAAVAPLMLGAPLLLGSWWGLAGLPVMLLPLAARILGEEAMLRAGLAGYDAYAARVRWRLLPGVW